VSDPRDRAVARALEVDADVEGRSGRGTEDVDWEVGMVETLWLGPCLGCLRICNAFASAFSCVRTKVASCYQVLAFCLLEESAFKSYLDKYLPVFGIHFVSV